MENDVLDLFKNFFQMTKPKEDPTKLWYADNTIHTPKYVDKRTGKVYTDVTEAILREGEFDVTNYQRLRGFR